MRTGLVVTILLIIALSILSAIRAYSPAVIDGSKSSMLEAPSTSVNWRAPRDSETTRRFLGLWLLAITGTVAVLRARSLPAIR